MEWKFILSNPSYGTVTIDEPIGWADIAINVKRDMNVHGLFFDYAVSLKFISNAYSYLKTAYESGGIDQYIEILVQIKCADDDLFEDFYKGKMFLGKLVFDCSDVCFAECPIEQAGCLMKFVNRIDQKVDLQLNKDYDLNTLPTYNFLPYNIKLKPKLVIKKTTSTLENYETCYTAGQTIVTGSGCQTLDQTVYIEPSITTIVLNEVEDTNQLSGSASDTTGTIGDWITAKYAGVYNIDVKINATLYAYITTGGQDSCGCSSTPVYVSDSEINNCLLTNSGIAYPAQVAPMHDEDFSLNISVNGTVVNTVLLHQNTFACNRFTKKDVCAYITASLTLNIGDVVKCFFSLHTNIEADRDFLFEHPCIFYYGYTQHESDITCTNPHINVSSSVLLPTTDSKVYMINEAFSRVTESITNDCLRVKSDYFGRTDSQPYTSSQDGCGSLESLTVGKHIRRFPDNLCLMNPSFKDLFDGMNSIHNIGYGIEPDANRSGYDWLRIEPMAYWYNNSVMMSCLFIPHLKRQVMAEWYISLFDFGYQKWEAEQTSGLDEFCVKKEYRTTLSEIKATKDVTCKLIASAYAMESTRQYNYSKFSSKDWRFDDEIFVICVRRDSTAITPYSLISVEQGADCINTSTALNILDPATIYNARISPNRNLLRWLPYLMANYSFDINDVKSYFRFVNGEANFLAEFEVINGCLYEKSGVNLKENQDIDSGDTHTVNQVKPIYKFELIDFDYPMSFSEFKTIKANPRGVIEFRSNDMQTSEYGFIHSISYKPNQGLATFNLITKYGGI